MTVTVSALGAQIQAHSRHFSISGCFLNGMVWYSCNRNEKVRDSGESQIGRESVTEREVIAMQRQSLRQVADDLMQQEEEEQASGATASPGRLPGSSCCSPWPAGI